MICPVCHNGACAPVHRNSIFATERDILLCEACRVYILHPVPGKEEIDLYYRSHYSKMGFNFPFISPEGYMKLFYAGMRAKSQYCYITSRTSLPEQARVLELGCATGNLLHLFNKQGCKTLGVELGESSSRYASTRYGLTVLNMDIDRALDQAGEGIDLVILSHTLEHLPNPGEILSKCAGILRELGVLFIELPNSYIGPPEGNRWEEFASILLNSDHMFNFSPGNLEILLGRSGFEVKDKTCFLAQKQAPLLKRMGMDMKANHIYRKSGGILEKYAPLFFNTLYLAGEYWGNRDTIAVHPADAPWSGTDEWMRCIAVKGH